MFRASFKGRFCTGDCKREFGGICTRNFSLFSFFSPSLQHKWRRRLRIDFQVLQTLSHTLYFLGASTDTHTRANSSCSYTLRTYTYIVIFFLLKLEMQSERVLEACNEKGFWDFFFFSLSFCMLGNESKIRGDFVSLPRTLSLSLSLAKHTLSLTHTHKLTGHHSSWQG